MTINIIEFLVLNVLQKNRQLPVLRQSEHLCIAARQPVSLAVFAQLQAGLDAVLRLTLQQLYFVLLQRLWHRLAERRQAHGVLMASGLHKRQVGVIEVVTRVTGRIFALPINSPVGVLSGVR